MTKVEKIQATYKSERADLLKELKKGAIDKRLHDEFLEQINRAENMDIMDVVIEGEE